MIARLLLDELSAEKKWDSLFAESEDFLASLADEALKEHHAGRTEPLDLDSLRGIRDKPNYFLFGLSWQEDNTL